MAEKNIIEKIMRKMIAFSEGNIHDIDHLVRVWAYAKTIGRLEGLDGQSQLVLEAAALVHDIACPSLRKEFGRADGKAQEKVGGPMAKDFLLDSGLSQEQIERAAFLVSKHHTFKGDFGADWQILLEADYIANACKNGWSEKNAQNFLERAAKSSAGKELIRQILCR